MIYNDTNNEIKKTIVEEIILNVNNRFIIGINIKNKLSLTYSYTFLHFYFQLFCQLNSLENNRILCDILGLLYSEANMGGWHFSYLIFSRFIIFIFRNYVTHWVIPCQVMQATTWLISEFDKNLPSCYNK